MKWNLTRKEISCATPILSERIKKLGVPSVQGFQRESFRGWGDGGVGSSP